MNVEKLLKINHRKSGSPINFDKLEKLSDELKRIENQKPSDWIKEKYKKEVDEACESWRVHPTDEDLMIMRIQTIIDYLDELKKEGKI